MAEIKLSLDDIYSKVGILFFTISFFVLGVFMNTIENQITKNVMYVSFILSYFCFIVLFGFFVEYFIKKALNTSKSFTTQIIIKIMDFYERNTNISKSILYLFTSLPILGIICYFKGWIGLIEVLCYPLVGFLLIRAYHYYLKNKTK